MREFDWLSWAGEHAKVGDHINIRVEEKIYFCIIVGFTPEIQLEGKRGWYPIVSPKNHEEIILVSDRGDMVPWRAMVLGPTELVENQFLNEYIMDKYDVEI